MKNNGEKNRIKTDKNFDEENLGKVSGGVWNSKAVVVMVYGGRSFKCDHPESNAANIKNLNQTNFNSFEFHDTAKDEW